MASVVHSLNKGKRGERQWRDFLRSIGFTDARRGQQFAGGPDSPDVVGGIPGTHVEVKLVEKLNIEDAMQQAERDIGQAYGQIPYVAHRRNRTEWCVTVRAANLVEFCKRVLKGMEP